jgi:hypothetical protein
VLRFPPSVLLAGNADAWYLAIDGSVEYEPEDEWLHVLRAIDGRRTVAEIVGDRPARRSIVGELLDLRVVEVR